AEQDMIFRICWFGRAGMLVGGTLLVLLGAAFYVFSWKKGYYGDKEKIVAATLVESLQDLEPEE
ncbi:MAG: hypothetical protein PVH19_00905, partial [Planctomycetia bacterium]